MKSIRTHYDNLKVAPNAPKEVIRAAYKALSQKHHPDRNGDSSESQRVMKIINQSYNVLSNEQQKKEHDDSIKKQTSKARLIEEKMFEQALLELESGKRRSGLWAKALAHSYGNEEKARGLYLKFRVQSISDEANIADGLKEQETAEEKEQYISTNSIDMSTLWIHILVWSIAPLILLDYLTS